MAKNQVQFQRGMSLMAFLDAYGTEQQCREALPRCAGPMASAARTVVMAVVVTSKVAMSISAIAASGRCR